MKKTDPAKQEQASRPGQAAALPIVGAAAGAATNIIVGNAGLAIGGIAIGITFWPMVLIGGLVGAIVGAIASEN